MNVMPRRNRGNSRVQGVRRAFRVRIRTLGSARDLTCPHCDAIVYSRGAAEDPDCRHLLFIEGPDGAGYRYACPELEEFREAAPREDGEADEPPAPPSDDEVAQLCRCHVVITVVPSRDGAVRVAIGERET
jgi:hypothetical protein